MLGALAPPHAVAGVRQCSRLEKVRRNQSELGLSVYCIDETETASLRRGFFSLDDHRLCTRPEMWYCATSQVRQVLFGPFHSHAQDWHTILANLPWFRAGDRITAFTADAVALDAVTPVAFSPLHMHHIHIERDVPHWWETHGDYAFDEKLGYRWALPSGTCVVHDGSRVSVYANMNDVCFSGNATAVSSAPFALNSRAGMAALRLKAGPISFYLRVKAELALQSERCQVVNKYALFYPADRFAEVDLLQRYNVGNDQHVMFWTIKLPHGGSLLPPARLHTHRARFAGYILIAGRHSLLSLTGLTDGCHVSNATCRSVSNMRSEVLSRAGGRLICKDDENAASFVSIEESGGGDGGIWDRSGSIICDPFTFAAGDEVTVFSFSAPRWAEELKTFPQHTILFFHYIPSTTPKPLRSRADELLPDPPQDFGKVVIGSEQRA